MLMLLTFYYQKLFQLKVEYTQPVREQLLFKCSIGEILTAQVLQFY